MTYNEKKSLYESIMKDVAKSVKRQINEGNDSELSSNERTFFIINSDNEKDKASFSIRYNSINRLYLIYYIIINASISDSFFEIKSNSADFEKNFKEFAKTKINKLSEDKQNTIDELIEKVNKKCFRQKEKSSDVARSIESTLPSIFNIKSSSNNNNRKINASNQSLYNRCLTNVRDVISRHNFDKKWATATMPLDKFTDEELLFRYSVALKVFNLEKPTNIQDVIKMGVFKNYIFEYINRKMRSTFENLPI